MARRRKSYRANSPVVAYNKIDLRDNNQPMSANNLAVGLRDGSYAAGTPREPQEGICLNVINQSTTVTTPYIIKASGGFSFTFSIFFDSATWTGKDFSIIDNDSATGIKRIRFYSISGNTTSFEINFNHSTGTNRSVLTSFTMIDGWNKFVVTATGSAVFKYYLNGIQTDSNSSFVTLIDDTTGTTFFTRGTGITYKIFDIRFWQYELNNEEIQKVFDYQILGTEDLFHKCDSGSNTELIDSSGNDNNGTIINYYTGFHDTQNIYSYQNDVGYTLSDGATYYYDNGGVDLIEAGFLIPRDESNPTKCCAYLSNGTQADLQYKGLCPSKLKFVNTPCFRGNNSGFFDAGNVSSFNIPNISIKYKVIKDLDDFIFRGIMAINQLPNVAGIGIAEGSAGDVLIYLQGVSGSPFRPPQHPVGYSANEVKIIQGSFVSFWRDGVEIFNQAITGTISSHASSTTKIGNANSNPLDSNFKIFDVEISELNSSGAFVQKLANFPLSEYMQTPSTHIAFDVIGGNYAALINGSTANRGIATRPDGDYSQLGYALSDGINYYYDQALTELIPSGVKIPAHAVQSGKCAAYTTGGVLADLTVVQDGKSFLDTESKVEAAEKPRLIQAEKTTGNRFFTDTSDNVVKKSFSDFTGNEDDQHFSDVSETGKAKSITAHTKELTGQQKNTELRITNN